jgi:hypothetical protein
MTSQSSISSIRYVDQLTRKKVCLQQFLDSIVVSIPACHAGDRGSIPRRGDLLNVTHFVFIF